MSRRDEVLRIVEDAIYIHRNAQKATKEIMALFPEALPIPQAEAEAVRDETLDASDGALGISDIIANQGSLR